MKKNKQEIKKFFAVKISFIFRRWIVERMRDFALKNNVRVKILSKNKEKPFLFTYYAFECSVEGEKENVTRFFDGICYFVDYPFDA